MYKASVLVMLLRRIKHIHVKKSMGKLHIPTLTQYCHIISIPKQYNLYKTSLMYICTESPAAPLRTDSEELCPS